MAKRLVSLILIICVCLCNLTAINLLKEETMAANNVNVSDKVNVEGFQISTIIRNGTGGIRTIASIEPVIEGKNVKSYGLIYGLAKVDNDVFLEDDNNMYYGANSKYVFSKQTTQVGITDKRYGNSTTATYIVQTIGFGANTVKAFKAQYKVRAYAILEDDSIVYSGVENYSVYELADYIYQNVKMNTREKHDYIYNTILKLIDPAYKVVDFDWTNVVVKPK